MAKTASRNVPRRHVGAEGRHNADLELARGRLIKGGTYRDLSTVLVMPTRPLVPIDAVQSWMGLIPSMNQKFTRIFVKEMEVGDAYNHAITQILANPELSKWRYLLTMEEDNLPPPDGVQRLYETIEGKVDGVRYDAVGGLYWTKGEGGQPMIYGDPAAMPLNFIPRLPVTDGIVPANGLGMGFTLFRLEMFRDPKLPSPWFRTLQEWDPQKGARVYTQDLYFFENAAKAGYRFACDCRVKVGHLDPVSGIVW